MQDALTRNLPSVKRRGTARRCTGCSKKDVFQYRAKVHEDERRKIASQPLIFHSQFARGPFLRTERSVAAEGGKRRDLYLVRRYGDRAGTYVSTPSRISPGICQKQNRGLSFPRSEVSNEKRSCQKGKAAGRRGREGNTRPSSIKPNILYERCSFFRTLPQILSCCFRKRFAVDCFHSCRPP